MSDIRALFRILLNTDGFFFTEILNSYTIFVNKLYHRTGSKYASDFWPNILLFGHTQHLVILI